MKIISIHHNPVKIYPIKDRLYMVAEGATCCLRTDAGCLVYTVKAGFEFDGRSGGRLVDWLVPNLGTQQETWAWLCHDVLYYDFDISFETANDLLRQQLRVDAGYGRVRSSMICASVDRFGASSFGTCHGDNRKYVDFQWVDDARGTLEINTINFKNTGC